MNTLSWFPHPTSLSKSDSRVRQLIEALGHRGYSLYLLTLEQLFAETPLDLETVPTATLSIKSWGDVLITKANSVLGLLQAMVDVGLIHCFVAGEQLSAGCRAHVEHLKRIKTSVTETMVEVRLRNYGKFLLDKATSKARALAKGQSEAPREKEIKKDSENPSALPREESQKSPYLATQPAVVHDDTEISVALSKPIIVREDLAVRSYVKALQE